MVDRIVYKINDALKNMRRCLGQGSVKTHADHVWGGDFARDSLREADEAIRELGWIDGSQLDAEISKAKEQARQEAYLVAMTIWKDEDFELILGEKWKDSSELIKLAAMAMAVAIGNKILKNK